MYHILLITEELSLNTYKNIQPRDNFHIKFQVLKFQIKLMKYIYRKSV